MVLCARGPLMPDHNDDPYSAGSVEPASERLLDAARLLLGATPPLDEDAIEDIAGNLEWHTFERGDVVCHQGDPSDGVYVVASGRARALYSSGPGAAPRVLSDIVRGEAIGEMGVLTGAPRSATVICTRDSALVRLPADTFERLVPRYPALLRSLARTVVARGQPQRVRAESGASIAIVPAGSDTGTGPARFAAALSAALEKHGTTLHLSSHRRPDLGRADNADVGLHELATWLNRQELLHRFLVLEADPHPSPWSERCIQQADCVLLVADADGPPGKGPMEHMLTRVNESLVSPRVELVLLHRRADRPPVGTARWLDARTDGLARHHHVHIETPGTVARIARLLAGKAVAVALGGGGARGFAHVGVLHALREAEVPIDVIVGTSMGAVIGAECALGWDAAEMLARNYAGFVRGHPLTDYTLPIVSLLSGRGLATLLRDLFGEVQLEDLWTPFVPVSSSISTGRPIAHRRGLLRKYIRASGSVPGLLPPVVDGSDLLVDGGVLTNLPAATARELVAPGPVIAVDVNLTSGLIGAPASYRAAAGEDAVLHGWTVLWRGANPFGEAVQVPKIQDVLERMTMLNGIREATDLAEWVDLYLHPSTDGVKFLDARTMGELATRGYAHARAPIAEWMASKL